MRAFHDVQPVIRHDLLGADLAAHLIDEDFRAAARQAVETGRLQALERLEDGQARLAREVLDLRRREGVNRDGREVLLNEAQHLLVIREAELRIEPALYHDLRATGLHRLPHLLEDFLMREQIGVLAALPPEERTEAALIDADIRVVDVAVDDERRRIAEALLADLVCLAPECDEVALAQQFLALSFCQSHTPSSLPPIGR